MADESPLPLTSGQQILHYRLVEKLGEGGMGVVWKAVDTTLDRAVAIKVLPPAFASDTERLARFEREARLLASLNHPNIATVYSVHVVAAVRYLSMELVPGEDLAQRLQRGPVPVAEAIEIARQIALALEAAHEQGVVHRDLKPANIRITPDGRVKVLDFGLAKALETDARSATMSQSPTFAVSAMTTGMIIGTAAYMSPEQARGQAVDRRADIWSFGVVLYEMLTACRAFDGETVSDTLAAVLRAEPDRAQLPADLPRAVRELLDRCFEKNARRRLRDIGEAVLTLEDVQAGRGSEPAGAATAPAPRANAMRAVMLAAVIAAVVAAVGTAMLRPAGQHPLHKYTLSFDNPGPEVEKPSLSPSGNQIAYIQAHRLWIRDFGQTTSRAVADGPDIDFAPLWSPDGAFVVFAHSTGLSRVDLASGAVAPICSVSDFVVGSGGAWGPDGSLLFTRGHDHVYRVPVGGGVPGVYLGADSTEGDLHEPFALPGNRGLLCVRHMKLTGPTVLAAIDPAGRRHDLVTLTNSYAWHPVYDPRGFVIFSRSGDGAGIWALPFSVSKLRSTGEAFLIAPGGRAPSLAADGTLAYEMGAQSIDARIVRVTRAGAIIDTLTPSVNGCWSMALSPDQKRILLETREGGTSVVWLFDLERNSQLRFAAGPTRRGDPSWSPDGREVAFTDAGTGGILLKPTDGSLDPHRFASGTQPEYTADGRHIVYCKNVAVANNDIWYQSVGGSDSTAFLATTANETNPMPAPAGGYLLFSSDESGQSEIYLRRFPIGEGRWQVSSNGGGRPQWNPQGDRIYYVYGDDVYEVVVSLSPAVSLGTPRVLFNISNLKMQAFGRYLFLPTANPDQFLTFRRSSDGLTSAVDAVVVENWPAEFAKKR